MKNSVVVLGVRISNQTMDEAVETLECFIREKSTVANAISIVNAHTLNLAYEDPSYAAALNQSAVVFGDGTGVRWAARSRSVEMRGNLVGTDLMPELFRRTAGRGYKMFLLGATEESISEAAKYCELNFPGWEVVGYHHGYVHDDVSRQAVISKINASGADALLVGMGNPLQEQWIHDNLSALQIPVCVGVGGLFNHWAGDINRAPIWVRRLGIEWLQILLQQPHKWRRYLLGNFSFVYRMRKKLHSDLEEMRS